MIKLIASEPKGKNYLKFNKVSANSIEFIVIAEKEAIELEFENFEIVDRRKGGVLSITKLQEQVKGGQIITVKITR